MGNVRASTKTRNMLIVDNVLLVAYDGFNSSELETECRSPMGEAKRLGDYIAEHYGGKIDILYGISYGCRVLMKVLGDERPTVTTTITDGMPLHNYPDIKRKWEKAVYRLFYTVCKDVTSFREIEEMEKSLIQPSFRRLKFVDCNKPFWRRLMCKAFTKAKTGCNHWHDYEMRVAPYEEGNPIYYEFTACPAAEFAKQYGLTEIMPALCNVDYGSKELIRARLVRTMTCVDGGDRNQFLRGRALRGPLFPAESGAFEAGDMAISCCDGMHGSQSESHFPLGYY